MCLIQTGLTPLAYASHWGSVEAVYLLLDRGADINQVLYYRVPACSSDTERAWHTLVTIYNLLDNYSVSVDNIVYHSLPGKLSPITRCTGRLPCAKIELGGANFVGVAVS